MCVVDWFYALINLPCLGYEAFQLYVFAVLTRICSVFILIAAVAYRIALVGCCLALLHRLFAAIPHRIVGLLQWVFMPEILIAGLHYRFAAPEIQIVYNVLAPCSPVYCHCSGVYCHCSAVPCHCSGVRPHCSAAACHCSSVRPHCRAAACHCSSVQPHCRPVRPDCRGVRPRCTA